MQLSPGAFNVFLRVIGQSFLRRQAYACPCINPHSGSPDVSCSYCMGKGRYWSDPVPGDAGIVGRDQLKKFSQFGPWDDGDILLSIPSDSALYAIGQYDRVTAVNRSEPFSLNMVASANNILRFSVISIERVSWLDSQKVMVNGDIPQVGSDGVINWGALRPPDKTTFSITGRRVPEYFVYMDLPLDRPMHHGATLPRRVILRRFDLYGR